MLEAWFFIAAALLIVSGGSKLVDPAPTAGALRAAHLPSAPWVAIGIALVEIGAGLAGTIYGGWASWGVAIIYLGFFGFVVFALSRRIPIASCGCFGRPDTPPTWGHAGFNLISAGVATAVGFAGAAPIEHLAGQPLAALPYLAFVALGVWIVYLLLSELPAMMAAR